MTEWSLSKVKQLCQRIVDISHSGACSHGCFNPCGVHVRAGGSPCRLSIEKDFGNAVANGFQTRANDARVARRIECASDDDLLESRQDHVKAKMMVAESRG